MRTLRIVLAALGLALFIAGSSPAEEKARDAKTHTGKIVKAGDGKLTMTDDKGEKEHTHVIGADAKITCDGKGCKLGDLKAGAKVKVTMSGDKVTKIEASTKDT